MFRRAAPPRLTHSKPSTPSSARRHYFLDTTHRHWPLAVLSVCCNGCAQRDRARAMKLSRLFAALFLLVVIPCTHAQKSKPIEKDEIAKWNNRMEECPADQPPYFWKVDYYDFKEDGTRQAIVIVSTCMTGTAGPDVHSVISRNSDGELEEMKIAEVDPKTYDNMFGNRNYDFVVENGLLVANFEDDLHRNRQRSESGGRTRRGTTARLEPEVGDDAGPTIQIQAVIDVPNGEPLIERLAAAGTGARSCAACSPCRTKSATYRPYPGRSSACGSRGG